MLFSLIKEGTYMIKATNLSYSFPQKDLYHHISFTIEEGQHCAFIGTSGSGKTTLIDMILFPDRYLYEGDLDVAPHCRMGYVSQFVDLDAHQDVTVFNYIGEKFIALQHELHALCVQMETATALDELLEKYQQVLDEFTAIGGDDFESQILKKLSLAHLEQHQDLPISKLSGGEFKLVQVIREMMIQPDLLIMDEPDVFLDFGHLNALEELINTYKGALLVITHNRYLLNHCFNKILHLENTALQEFDGRYIDYTFNLLQGKIETQELAAADTAEIERNQEIIDRLRTAATNFADASFGKSLNARIKIQQRLEARRILPPFVAIKQPAIAFPLSTTPEEKTILKVSHYSMGFKETLLEDISFELGAREKVALIGPNGCGKTTLLRELFKNDHPAITIAEGTRIAFLSQLQGERLNESHTILEEFLEMGFINADAITAYLRDFGFDAEMISQKISHLSGGEKNLLQLAKIATCEADLLLLDEPTSHLDTYSQLALEKALDHYQGAVLMISHDFYSIAHCMDRLFIIENKALRPMSIRKFRKMIYAHHFDKDYLEIEQKKKALEMRIEGALEKNDFEQAKKLAEQLPPLLKQL